jgi:lysophospholipase L1-like esterase
MKRSILISLIVILTIFFGIYLSKFFLIKSLDKYYDTRLNPLQEDEVTIDTTKAYEYVLLGDSHCSLWNLNRPNTLNLGVGGQTSSQIKWRTTLFKPVKAKYLILSAGTNDARSVATNPDKRSEIVNNCINNISQIIKEAKPYYQDIYIINIPPDFKVSFPFMFINYDETLLAKREINSGIDKLSKEFGVKVVDSNKLLKGKSGKEYSSDGLHLGYKSYEILEKYIP